MGDIDVLLTKEPKYSVTYVYFSFMSKSKEMETMCLIDYSNFLNDGLKLENIQTSFLGKMAEQTMSYPAICIIIFSNKK